GYDAISGGTRGPPRPDKTSVSITILYRHTAYTSIYMSGIVEIKFNNNAIACVVVNGNPWYKGQGYSDIAGLRGHQ
ncbi:MAG: hypothetical protein ACKPKO_54170, partial [Candidatus Fonsibacter sp.]